MAQIAAAAGVPLSSITAEARSRDTIGNIWFTKPLLGGPGGQRVIVVTSHLHAARHGVAGAAQPGTKLAGNAAQKANRTLPQIEKILAEAPATGWRPRTRLAGMCSGPGRRRERRPRRPGNGAATARAMSRAPTGPAPSRGRTSPTRTCG